MPVTKRKMPTIKRKKSTYKKRKFNMTRRKYVPKGLTVKRMVCATQPFTYSSVATTNFWKYNTVALTSGMVDYASGATIASLTNLSEYSVLFEQYKLSAFKITFRPKFSNLNQSQINNTTGATTYAIPYFCIVKDPMGSQTPLGTWTQSTLNTLLENGGKVYRADRPVTIYMKPKISEQFGGGSNRYLTPKFSDLGTSAGTSMPHRGYHMFCFNQGFDSTAITQQSWDVYVTYYLRFKNPR